MLSNFPHIKSLILMDAADKAKDTRTDRFHLVHDSIFFQYPKADSYAHVQVVVSEAMVGYHVFLGKLLIHTFNLGPASHIDAMYTLAKQFSAPMPDDLDAWVIRFLADDILKLTKCATFLRKMVRSKEEADELLNGLSLTMDWQISEYVYNALRRDWRGADQDYMCEEIATFFLMDPHPPTGKPKVCKTSDDIHEALQQLEDEADEEEEEDYTEEDHREAVEEAISDCAYDFNLFDLLNTFSTEHIARIYIEKFGMSDFEQMIGDGCKRLSKLRNKMIDVLVCDYDADTLSKAAKSAGLPIEIGQAFRGF